jgi:hypothetical protein
MASEEELLALSEPIADSRGRVKNADTVRTLRAREQWERYDTVIVGQGAQDQSKGWFNNFAGFAAVSQISWFQSRDSNVDLAYTNQKSERYDYAQDIYNCNIEFMSPAYQAEFDTLGESQKEALIIWTQELPKAMGFETLLADADIIAQGPGTAFMAGRGNAGGFATDTGASMVSGGNNGLAMRDNSWSFPEPIMIAAKAKLTVRAYIASPIKNLLAQLPGPGTVEIPNGLGGYITVPNWYGIRVSFRGPRYLQLRGARSAA